MANARVRGRPIAPLVLSAQERAYLERQVRRHRVANQHFRRYRALRGHWLTACGWFNTTCRSGYLAASATKTPARS